MQPVRRRVFPPGTPPHPSTQGMENETMETIKQALITRVEEGASRLLTGYDLQISGDRITNIPSRESLAREILKRTPLPVRIKSALDGKIEDVERHERLDAALYRAINGNLVAYY